MKKSLFLFALVLVSAITLSSCLSFFSRIASQTFRNNLSELPVNESAVITFENFSEISGFSIFRKSTSLRFWVKRWNNIDINKALYRNGSSSSRNDKAELIVPPGDNSFLFDLFFSFEGYRSPLPSFGNYEMRNIELQYYLAAGRKYIVKAGANTTATDEGHTFTDRTGKTHKVITVRHEIIIGIYNDVKDSEPLREWRLER
jgi:hypothetical protein